MLRAIKIIIHACFFGAFLGVSLQTQQAANIPASQFLSIIVINTLWASLLFYGAYFGLIRFFERRQFVRYALLSILLAASLTALFLSIHTVLSQGLSFWNISFILTTCGGSLFIVQCGSLIRGFINWITQLKDRSELETRQLRTELEILKAQINPHFLFNTLNNIDSLIHVSPQRASDSVIALSDMLRYMIYDTSPTKVPLAKEFDCLRQYVSLQQLRLNDSQQIQLNLTQNGNETIAPLLLLPFVENACKYASWTGKTPAVVITCSCTNSEIIFECTNTIKQQNRQSNTAGGVGLENVKRRLQLIYPLTHTLQISQNLTTFEVKLHLPIV